METERKSLNKYLVAFVLTVALFCVQLLFSRLGGLTANMFDYSSIDPDGVFALISVHHIVQMLLALIVIVIIRIFMKTSDFKLRPRLDGKGIKYTILFSLILILYYLVVYTVGAWKGSINTYGYELNTLNVTGTLGFQLLLSGPSEEILFRSLPITVLMFVLDPESRRDRVIAIFAAAVLFGLAHINFFAMSVPLFQVCYAFVLGLAYGFVFFRSKSVIYPMLMHSLSNVISVGGCYLYMLFWK